MKTAERLFRALERGNLPVIEEVLNTGYRIDTVHDGRTALMVAALYGQCDAIELLIEKGAEVGKIDNDGKTALSHAEEEGESDAVNLLRNCDS